MKLCLVLNIQFSYIINVMLFRPSSPLNISVIILPLQICRKPSGILIPVQMLFNSNPTSFWRDLGNFWQHNRLMFEGLPVHILHDYDIIHRSLLYVLIALLTIHWPHLRSKWHLWWVGKGWIYLFCYLQVSFGRERLKVMHVGCWVFRSLFIRLLCEEISFTWIGGTFLITKEWEHFMLNTQFIRKVKMLNYPGEIKFTENWIKIHFFSTYSNILRTLLKSGLGTCFRILLILTLVQDKMNNSFSL